MSVAEEWKIKIKETLEEKEGAESGVTLSVASSTRHSRDIREMIHAIAADDFISVA